MVNHMGRMSGTPMVMAAILFVGSLSCHVAVPFPRVEEDASGGGPDQGGLGGGGPGGGGPSPGEFVSGQFASRVAHWAFDDETANDGIGENHGDGRHGVRYGVADIEDDFYGKAIDLGPTDSEGKPHVLVKSDTEDDEMPGTLHPDEVTVALWMKPSKVGDPKHSPPTGWVLQRGSPDLSHYGLRLEDTGNNTFEVVWSFNSGNSQEQQSNNQVKPEVRSDKAYAYDQWYHVTGTIDLSDDYTEAHLVLYVNGEKVADRRFAGSHCLDCAPGHTWPLIMGREYDHRDKPSPVPCCPYVGLIDDVVIFGSALSPQFVTLLPSGVNWGSP